jgi:hypothetical protein
MKKERPAALRFRKLPHEQRIAMRECLLRGAARNYADAADGVREESAAEELRAAAIDYAVTLLQWAAAIQVEPRGKRETP